MLKERVVGKKAHNDIHSGRVTLCNPLRKQAFRPESMNRQTPLRQQPAVAEIKGTLPAMRPASAGNGSPATIKPETQSK
jgi:hypothetical protein